MSAYFKAFLANPEPFLKDLAKSPQDAQQFLKEVPEEYKMLFAKPKKPVQVERPDINDITGMELTAFYNPRADRRSANITIQTKIFTDAKIDLENETWMADAIMVSKKNFPAWKKSQIKQKTAVSDEQSLNDLEACFEQYSHAGYAYVRGGTIGYNITKAIICADIENKVITNCTVWFDDYHIRPSTFIYTESNKKSFAKNIFAKYRYSKKPKRGWVHIDSWVCNMSIE